LIDVHKVDNKYLLNLAALIDTEIMTITRFSKHLLVEGIFEVKK
jgi:hypothetical protein